MAFTWKTYLSENRDRFLAETLDFLRIPSISSLPEHAADVWTAAEWVAQRLSRAGIESVQVMETGGHPIVYGEWLHAPEQPTVLVYGHFDTQPVDPIELWDNPPFEPTVVGNRVYARGAADDKGNMIIPILAVEALLQSSGTLPLNVKFFFEGQEEIGSPQIPDFVEKHRDLLACDFVISADGGQYSEDQPSLIVSTRGLTALQIDVTGPRSDRHSGGHGGAIQNPIHALVRLLDSMRSPDGKITVEGFYDRVIPLSDDDKQKIAAVPFDEADYMAFLDVDAVFGEPGYTTRERNWGRPTLEVNGIWGGFQGDGTKTVLPSTAHAKISCRIVADQDPEEIRALIAAHVERHRPPGVRVSVTLFPGMAKPYRLPPDHPGNMAAFETLAEIYGKEPYFVRAGGTVPVLRMFLDSLGAYTIFFAFGLDDENVHAPNEFFRISCWERGQVAYCRLFERLGM